MISSKTEARERHLGVRTSHRSRRRSDRNNTTGKLQVDMIEECSRRLHCYYCARLCMCGRWCKSRSFVVGSILLICAMSHEESNIYIYIG